MYGLYSELLKQGFLFFLPTTMVQSDPPLSAPSNKCNPLLFQWQGNCEIPNAFFCFHASVHRWAYMPRVESALAYPVRHGFTRAHHARTYTHTTKQHAHTQLLQPSKPNYSLPPASLCQPVMSATERQWDSWLSASGWPCRRRGGERRQEVKRRLALERFAK